MFFPLLTGSSIEKSPLYLLTSLPLILPLGGSSFQFADSVYVCFLRFLLTCLPARLLFWLHTSLLLTKFSLLLVTLFSCLWYCKTYLFVHHCASNICVGFLTSSPAFALCFTPILCTWLCAYLPGSTINLGRLMWSWPVILEITHLKIQHVERRTRKSAPDNTMVVGGPGRRPAAPVVVVQFVLIACLLQLDFWKRKFDNNCFVTVDTRKNVIDNIRIIWYYPLACERIPFNMFVWT